MTCSIARIVLYWFDCKFREICQRVGVNIKMYKRYIDYVNLVCDSIKSNMNYSPKTRNLFSAPEESNGDTEEPLEQEKHAMETPTNNAKFTLPRHGELM